MTMQNEISRGALHQTSHEAAVDEDVLLLWILVWSELVAFGILLTAFLIMSGIHADDFAVARIHLNPGLAAANTVVLLTSGWQAAIAARRRASPSTARIPLCLAAAFGFLFVVIKCIEYAAEFRYSFDATFSYFFQLYFLITGFHLLHVVFGSFVLLLVAWRPARGNILLIATLWHAIDLVWLVMFPIIYLV
ncbi:Cytochrome c oxidase subunit 3 [compost metagenome]